ncbi:hypothetical protein LSG31_00425 [Fodinisporobacter ferrooxydans]|uniref:Tail fiber protein n=1 Tax=Fodinisporobacter ferrooxydans TaxID=2901836 RepID=A0ABY4CNL3_9BACL|nr:hypothetical protein LSG31_00425 [Alicyclobacillaceae bacterium MYW30-H2]
MQKLTDQQYAAFNQSIPSLGTRGDKGRPTAGDIINSLFLLGGKIVTYTSNATANTQDTVYHGLGYVPNGYIVIGNGNGGVVYTGANADANNLYLKCTTASNSVTLLVF